MQISARAAAVKESSTLAIAAKAQALKAQGVNVIGFGVGEPDFPTPAHIKQAAVDAIQDGMTRYTPSSGIPALRKAICEKLLKDNGLTYEPAQIVVSNGAKHSLTNVFSAIVNPGDEVLIPAPYWLSYSEMVAIAGGVPVIVATSAVTGLKATVELLCAAKTDKTVAIVLNSPSNPTGMVYSREELQAIADFAVANDLYVVSDEIYEKLIYDTNCEHISIASLGDEIYARTIVVNGLSKSHSMTGWRIGYTASSAALAKAMGNLQSHGTSNPNSVAQYAAVAALTGEQECVETMRQEFARRRDYIYERITKIPGLAMLRPEGAFYAFVDVTGLYGKKVNGQALRSAAEVAEALFDAVQIAVVPCADFGAPDYIRLSYAISMEQIREGMDRLERFVTENCGA